ncbi:hypothetical protein G4B88_008788 [Cannabis sativa]|uniref:Serine-threonine/tyrosine-protein kinase catalytic domain-containing protein n=1 Tax=Cannabis sativa TaxID=3483 RepID=A0A7J6E4M2_CANSA|nr:hypothetical protein G4B88_008788 [Cannabis sativa]
MAMILKLTLFLIVIYMFYACRDVSYNNQRKQVFAFGVVALEILTGRPNSCSSLGDEKTYLHEWAWDLYEEDCEIELVDSKLSEEFNREEVRRTKRIAFLCTQASPAARPSMSKVAAMLSADTDAGGH